MTTPIIPVPVDVLRELLDNHRWSGGYYYCVCCDEDIEDPHGTDLSVRRGRPCPIPALREALEEVEKR